MEEEIEVKKDTRHRSWFALDQCGVTAEFEGPGNVENSLFQGIKERIP
jgi:hypothetical protein